MNGRWLLVVSVLVFASCTKDNPRACAEGDPCRDPALPFCDLDGLIGGVPGACIAVDCTPGAFAACDEDRALQCNAIGDTYETVDCERGCDPARDGCRLCNANETVCVNGVTATCDATGAVVSMEPCPLGCFESEPRCRDVQPSNGLALYLDMTSTGPDVVLTGDARFSTIDGDVFDGDGSTVTIPSFVIQAPPGGVPVRVFVVRSLVVENLAFLGPQTQQVIPAVAVVAHGDIRITGTVDLSPAVPRVAPGSLITGACVGSGGDYDMLNGSEYTAGSGGGGGATAGGRGGNIDSLNAGGAAGVPTGSDTLEPLVGGCAGGGDASGGGGLQLVSRSAVRIDAAGVINAAGEGGLAEQGVMGGGGSGGSVLIEAPVIVLGTAAAIAANGGSGATGGSPAGGTYGGVTTQPAMAPSCGSRPVHLCGIGGSGGAQGVFAAAGGDLTYVSTSGVLQWAGGGGGSVGRVRLNTADGTYVKASDVVESPVPSLGTLRTR
jgi:hypothetical protein